MKSTIGPIEIEVDNDYDRNFFFSPLSRVVRGRLDFGRLAMRSPNALLVDHDLGRRPIPGEVIGIDSEGTIYIREPLQRADCKTLRERLAQRGYIFQDERTDYPDADYDRCLSAMHRAVRARVAKVIHGEFPKTIPVDPDSKPRVDPRDEQIATVIDSLNSLTKTVTELAKRVGLN